VPGQDIKDLRLSDSEGDARPVKMVFNTATVAGVVTPAVIQTFLSHVG
jgi:hypothetical protein